MTGEEMERAIEFLLKNQASFDLRLEETNRQIAQTNQRLEAFAETQAELIRVVTRTFETQNRINEDVRRWQEESRRWQEASQRGSEELRLGIGRLGGAGEAAWAAIRELGARQGRTERTVERLAEVVRRHVEGGGGNDAGG